MRRFNYYRDPLTAGSSNHMPTPVFYNHFDDGWFTAAWNANTAWNRFNRTAPKTEAESNE
jgi:hypothetical protein